MRSEPGVLPPEAVIPLCVPAVQGNEWKYVKECLDTNWLSSAGPFVDRFERLVADRVGVKHAVATVNGTAALHVALLVAGVQPDDEVLVSTLSFIAPANAVRYVGARPVFIDAEPEYWQMDPGRLVDFVERQCRWSQGALYDGTTGRRVRAILPVHVLGHPVDMRPILDVARKYDLVVVEDATEGLGAAYEGTAVGALGDLACLSFNGNKIVTTGGGGMVLTNNETWAARARYLTTQAKDDAIEYIHHEVGYNYRLTNVQAALGVAQCERLEKYVTAKRRTAQAYTDGLRHVDGIVPMREALWAFSTFWMFTVLVDERRFGMDSRSLLRVLAGHGIESRPLWQPLHRSPAHAGAVATGCLVADDLYQRALSLPCSVGLTPAGRERVIQAIAEDARR